MTATAKLRKAINGRAKPLVTGLLGIVVAGAGAYLVLGRQVVTADVDRENRRYIMDTIDQNTQAITDVTHRLGAVEVEPDTASDMCESAPRAESPELEAAPRPPVWIAETETSPPPLDMPEAVAVAVPPAPATPVAAEPPDPPVASARARTAASPALFQ